MNNEPRMAIRRMPFSFTHIKSAHWHPVKPEFSQVVNGASLAMPYLEPYLINSMRQARPLIEDPILKKDLDLYITQEARHSGQHRNFNNQLSELGYQCIEKLEQTFEKDYQRLGEEKSLKFNLAYAEGFESMALAIGQMLIEEREYLFAGSDTAIASLVLWHFVEEIEHKNVAFDVFEHLYDSYPYRLWGLLYATGHIFWRTGQAYRALLKEDGLWSKWHHRWALTKQLARIFKNLTPKMLKILKPSYHPRQIADPEWATAWTELFKSNPAAAANLDTNKLSAAQPLAL